MSDVALTAANARYPYRPLSELQDLQAESFHEALLEAATFEDLPGKWQAATLAGRTAKLRLIRSH